MATAFQIERNVPAPNSGGGRLKYPFPEMKVGDSFFVASGEGNVRGSAYAYGDRNGMKFTTPEVDGGIRVWRVA